MSGDERGYNGWSNYETWAVALWIDNDQWSEGEARAIVEGAARPYDAADALKQWIEDDNPLADKADLYSDLLTRAINRVDWYELAAHFRDETYEAGDPAHGSK